MRRRFLNYLTPKYMQKLNMYPLPLENMVGCEFRFKGGRRNRSGVEGRTLKVGDVWRGGGGGGIWKGRGGDGGVGGTGDDVGT
jgi:hypothetical protein